MLNLVSGGLLEARFGSNPSKEIFLDTYKKTALRAS